MELPASFLGSFSLKEASEPGNEAIPVQFLNSCELVFPVQSVIVTASNFRENNYDSVSGHC